MEEENRMITLEDQIKDQMEKHPQNLSPKQLVEYLRNQKRWNLSRNIFSKIQFQELFQKIKKPQNLCFLWLNGNKIENICNMVTLPEYSQLKILSLGGNNIESLQPLQNAQMASLQQLYLWKNRLTRIDSLRKMYVPNLKEINLISNYIIDFSKISEMNCEKLQVISLSQNKQLVSIDWITKIWGGSKKIVVTFNDTNVMQVLGKPCKKGNKRAKHYYFPSQRFAYK